MKLKIIIILNLLITSQFLVGCKKFVEIDGPKTSLSNDNIYKTDVSAISVVTGIYTKLSSAYLWDGGLTGISYFSGLSSDEFYLMGATQNLQAYYSNTLNSQYGSEIWNNVYATLFVINSAIEGVSASSSLTPSVRKQLLGEVRFLRAFCFFYMVNLYGDVPLILTTDYKTNSIMARTSKEKVWEQILGDLDEAKSLLSADFLDASLLKSTLERVRPTKWAAIALLARSNLYLKNWKLAEELSSDILNNSGYELVSVDQAFKKNSNEAVWQLQPVITGSNTQDANAFILNYAEDISYKPALSEDLVNSFEVGDLRKINWVNSVVLNDNTYHYAYKYKLQSGNSGDPVLEYTTCLRLSEQLLIRAEARIQLGEIAQGIADLNILRARANDRTALPALQLKPLDIILSKEAALKAVEQERRVELFSEWGHRWLDLKRTGKVDVVMDLATPKKMPGVTWKTDQQLYPIPLEQIRLNPQLKQNSGY